MFKQTFSSNSVDQTILVAENFIKNLTDLNSNIFLNGDLGSGKTQFTKGLFKGLGFSNYLEINSPTFEIISTYNFNNLKINHMDLYRIDALDLEDELWLEDEINSNSLCIIEWGNKFDFHINKKIYEIEIKFLGENERQIKIFTN